MKTRMIWMSLLLLVITTGSGLTEDRCVFLVGKALNARSSYSVKEILEQKVGNCTVQVLDYMQDLLTADLSSHKVPCRASSSYP